MTNPKVLFINHDHPYTFKVEQSHEWVTKSLGRRLNEDLEI